MKKKKSKKKKQKNDLTIQELIQIVQEELKDNPNIPESRPNLYEMEEFDLEINFVVKKAKDRSGRFMTPFIALEKGNTKSLEHSHTLKLKFKPTSEPPSD